MHTKVEFRPLKVTLSGFCLVFAIFFIFSGIGCEQKAAVRERPAPEVVVEHPVQRDVQFYFTTIGRAEAFEFDTIPARVSGQLKEMYYEPGRVVFEGDPLFLIEPDRYEAKVESAQAALESAQAESVLKKLTLDRNLDLLKTDATSKQSVDEADAQYKISLAKIKDAEATLRSAELDLSYTKVIAPVSGKTDRNFIDLGNIVGTGEDNTKLTTVANLDPMYVYFEVSSSQLNLFNEIQSQYNDEAKKVLERLKKSNDARQKRREELSKVSEESAIPSDRELESKKEATEAETATEPRKTGSFAEIDMTKAREENGKLEDRDVYFSIALDDGPGKKRDYRFDGILEMTANMADPETGTITCRGQVPNESYIITHKQSVHVRVPTIDAKNAVLIREEAISRDMNNKYVYVIDENNIASRRNVELGPSEPDGYRVVLSGLKHEDRYVSKGIQKVRFNQPVRPMDETKLAQMQAYEAKKKAVEPNPALKLPEKKVETPVEKAAENETVPE